MGKIWILRPMDNFMTEKSDQDLPHIHFAFKEVKGVFIRTNDPYLAICFPPSLLLSVSPTLSSFLLPTAYLSPLSPSLNCFPPSYPLSITQVCLFYQTSWDDFCCSNMFTCLNESGAYFSVPK